MNPNTGNENPLVWGLSESSILPCHNSWMNDERKRHNSSGCPCRDPHYRGLHEHGPALGGSGADGKDHPSPPPLTGRSDCRPRASSLPACRSTSTALTRPAAMSLNLPGRCRSDPELTARSWSLSGTATGRNMRTMPVVWEAPTQRYNPSSFTPGSITWARTRRRIIQLDDRRYSTSYRYENGSLYWIAFADTSFPKIF